VSNTFNAATVDVSPPERADVALQRRLLELLHDTDPRVRREAIIACSRLSLRASVPALISHLRTAQLRDVARAALVTFGNRAVGTIGDYLVDDTVPLPIRRELPLVLAAVGTREAANELLRAPYPTDAVLLLRLLEARFVSTVARIFNRLCAPRVRFGSPWCLGSQKPGACAKPTGRFRAAP
jgi:hypothetical protein